MQSFRAARWQGPARWRSRPAASAHAGRSRRAPSPSATRSGSSTHIVYYDTAYGDWPRIVAAPAASWASATCATASTPTRRRSGATGTSATTRRSSSPPRTGCASPSAWAARAARRARSTSSLDVVGGPPAQRRRGARGAQRVRQVRRRPPLAARAGRLRARAVPQGRRRAPPLRVAAVARARRSPRPGARAAARQPARAGSTSGTSTPTPAACRPTPAHMQLRARAARAASRAASRSGPPRRASTTRCTRPVDGQPPVSEQAGAVYLLRTFLEHFRAGIRRTYAYELLDEKPEPARPRPPSSTSACCATTSRRKPAFTALRNLLTLVGPRPARAARLRPLRLGLPGRASGVRRLVLQRADGTYLVALWRLDSVWDRTARRDVRVRGALVTVAAARRRRRPRQPPGRRDDVGGPAARRPRARRAGRRPARPRGQPRGHDTAADRSSHGRRRSPRAGRSPLGIAPDPLYRAAVRGTPPAVPAARMMPPASAPARPVRLRLAAGARRPASALGLALAPAAQAAFPRYASAAAFRDSVGDRHPPVVLRRPLRPVGHRSWPACASSASTTSAAASSPRERRLAGPAGRRLPRRLRGRHPRRTSSSTCTARPAGRSTPPVGDQVRAARRQRRVPGVAQRARPLRRDGLEGRPADLGPRPVRQGQGRPRPALAAGHRPVARRPQRARGPGRPVRLPRRRQHPPLHRRLEPEPAPHRRRADADQGRLGTKPRRGHRGRLPHLAARPRTSTSPPPTSRPAAVYTLRTVLEHFADGIDRTYLYELLDQRVNLLDSQSNYGLLHTDFSPKPAFTQLKNLLAHDRLVAPRRR